MYLSFLLFFLFFLNKQNKKGQIRQAIKKESMLVHLFSFFFF